MAPAEKFSCKSKREGDACVSKLVVISEVGEARGKPTVQAAIERMNRAKILNGGGRLPQKRGYVKKRIFEDVKGYLATCATTLKELTCSR
ncbi:hypothetical protein KC19_9G035200 [Ceratodon purpureus]|uniref:Uncharacterized protein n=1 Tax=Ceratodon purpureus TaxID=3225 RepID=A0A8T0GPY3_CERPU|nr:hypothetical protein KC19_9G035200 [Ceratodon purpureus]KAG0561080.1 hypothetical protein KC19_9G035200 [Ceratodon purpureus]